MATATTNMLPLFRSLTGLRRLGMAAPVILGVGLSACATDGQNGPATSAPQTKAASQTDTQAQTDAPQTGDVIAPEGPTADITPAEPAAPAEMDRLVTTYTVKKGDDLLEIARDHDLGFLELRAANPGVDPWLPKPGSTLILPTVHLLAETMERGILINLAEMRLFRFEKGQVVATHPLGIGRDGLETPIGQTSVIRMAKNPTWYPTPRMRRENPNLPAAVGPGPDNPFGNRAIYLGWDLYRIHGTNIPWGVGRRVSSGCLRMYPEDVEKFYEQVSVGMPVKVVDRRLVAEWRDGKMWIEVYPTAEGWDALEARDPAPDMPLTTEMTAALTRAVPQGEQIDWDKVRRAVSEMRGYPVAVSP